jgi:hypothetical protein
MIRSVIASSWLGQSGVFKQLQSYPTNWRRLCLKLTDNSCTHPQYTGELTKWEFAIYKYSNGAYDPSEWFFPGAEYIDGTIEGAMKAGLVAYPV